MTIASRARAALDRAGDGDAQRIIYGVWAEFGPDHWDEVSQHYREWRATHKAQKYSRKHGVKTYVEENILMPYGDQESRTIAAYDEKGEPS